MSTNIHPPSHHFDPDAIDRETTAILVRWAAIEAIPDGELLATLADLCRATHYQAQIHLDDDRQVVNVMAPAGVMAKPHEFMWFLVGEDAESLPGVLRLAIDHIKGQVESGGGEQPATHDSGVLDRPIFDTEPDPIDTLWSGRLVYDFDVSDRSPVVKGTWVTVDHVVGCIVNGSTWSDILRNHPELSHHDIRACVAYAVAEGESRGAMRGDG